MFDFKAEEEGVGGLNINSMGVVIKKNWEQEWEQNGDRTWV